MIESPTSAPPLVPDLRFDRGLQVVIVVDEGLQIVGELRRIAGQRQRGGGAALPDDIERHPRNHVVDGVAGLLDIDVVQMNSASAPWLVAVIVFAGMAEDASFNWSVVAPVEFACKDR